MEHTEVEVLLGCEMGHTGHERLLKRAIISPFGKRFVDSGVMDGRLPMGICGDGQAPPLHSRAEHPQNKVAQFLTFHRI
jgi:hypothetical protein